ncbi:MAG: ATP-binding cassette domain-containing protein, partial [Thiohalorhabdaceae bacterium]
VSRANVAEAMRVAKTRCGIDDVGARLLGNLSKGYQQRVGLAQAIIHNPEVIVLDEPTIGLDPIQVREIRDLIRELGREHGVILSTHILPEVQAVCNRVQIIHQGRLVFSESLADLNQRLAPTSLRLELAQPPAPSALEAIDGVERV